ncbi:MAG: GDSL-type esterase/lipase family protein [Oscillospiraceae bacterium]|nr:GDSL-type esterase/lipase family protein [Oscillospiraceae bacterium]
MKNILCFGDSNTWGYDFTTYNPALGTGRRMEFDERWPGIVQNALGGDYRIIEDALNARTNMVEDPYFPHRLGIDSLETALDAQAPLDLVIIQMGVNELKHMFNLTAGMIAFGVEKLVVAAQQLYYGYQAPKVLLIAPAPVKKDIADMMFGFSYGPIAYEKSCQFGSLYREVAQRHSCGFIDCAEMDFEINNLDGLHYSKADHRKLAKAVTDKIKEILG